MTEHKFEYILERTPALSLFGKFYTYYYPALIINTALIIIAVSLLVNLNFSGIAFIYVLLFFVPFFFIVQFKFIRKGRRAMNSYCILVVNDDEIKYETGFPNTTNRQIIKFSVNDVEKLIVKGSDFPGYYVEINRKSINDALAELAAGKKRKRPEISRFGLWLNVTDALAFANELADVLHDISVEEQYSLE